MVRENVGFDTTVSEIAMQAFEEQKDDLQKQLDAMLAKYDIKAQTEEMTAYFEAEIEQTGTLDMGHVSNSWEQSKLERKVMENLFKSERDKKQVSPEQ